MVSEMTAGAIGIKTLDDEITIEKCNFINNFSSKNAGAIYADVVGQGGNHSGKISIINSSFINCISEFGGCLLQLGGNLTVEDSVFDSNMAYFSGGAIYTSWADAAISNSNFTSNGIQIYDNYHTYGGACYFDAGDIIIDSCIFKNNTGNGSSLVLYDSVLNLKKKLFQ